MTNGGHPEGAGGGGAKTEKPAQAEVKQAEKSTAAATSGASNGEDPKGQPR